MISARFPKVKPNHKIEVTPKSLDACSIATSGVSTHVATADNCYSHQVSPESKASFCTKTTQSTNNESPKSPRAFYLGECTGDSLMSVDSGSSLAVFPNSERTESLIVQILGHDYLLNLRSIIYMDYVKFFLRGLICGDSGMDLYLNGEDLYENNDDTDPEFLSPQPSQGEVPQSFECEQSERLVFA
jgi:hypothetical protein